MAKVNSGVAAAGFQTSISQSMADRFSSLPPVRGLKGRANFALAPILPS
jgi:hypothetical protein